MGILGREVVDMTKALLSKGYRTNRQCIQKLDDYITIYLVFIWVYYHEYYVTNVNRTLLDRLVRSYLAF